MKQSLTCILCPRGCRLTVSDEKNSVEVKGAGCPRGITYAEEERSNPVRVVTSTVTLRDAVLGRLPVKTAGPVPKDRIFPVVEELRKIKVCAPVKAGEVVLKNAGGTGQDVIASRSVARKGDPG